MQQLQAYSSIRPGLSEPCQGFVNGAALERLFLVRQIRHSLSLGYRVKRVIILESGSQGWL